MKKSVKIPDILLNLALGSIAGAKKRKWERRKRSPPFSSFHCFHCAPPGWEKGVIMLSIRVPHVSISLR